MTKDEEETLRQYLENNSRFSEGLVVKDIPFYSVSLSHFRLK